MVKFKDMLLKQRDNTMIFLGTFDGSGWIYIETKETMLDNINKIDTYMKKILYNKYDVSKNRIIELESEMETVQSKLRKRLTKMERRGLERREMQITRNLGFSRKEKEKYETMISNNVHLADREVKDCYILDGINKGIAILIDGYENGKLWFKDEKKIF